MNVPSREMIESESKILRQLHENIGITFKNRKRDKQAWRDAIDAFHGYQSKLDPFLEQVYLKKEYTAKRLIEFVIQFLEVDPRFFRSGYHKERMIQKIKRAPLNAEQRSRLRAVVLDAVRNRPGREFKHYGRLALAVMDADLLTRIEQIAETSTGARRSRARFMLMVITGRGVE